METLEDKILRFITQDILRAAPGKIAADDLLIEDGYLDSLGLQDLVTFIERDLGVALQDDDLTPENFSSAQTIAALVEKNANP